ncbi:MAG: DUF4123 domain-containing protein [Gemmatimonadales bacterium]|nr:DUF4123 domain-containing protein [Gemmatimonadales bacterium]
MTDLVVGHQTSILGFRRQVSTGLWAVVDAVGAGVLERLGSVADEAKASLFRGPVEAELAAIAPWLVRVDLELFDWIVGALWNQPWGVFATVDPGVGLEELRTQFRRFLLVEGPGGHRYYFRFYDPRVLDRFWGMASAEQVGALFAMVRTFAYPDRHTLGVRVVRSSGQSLSTKIGRVRFTGRMGQIP